MTRAPRTAALALILVGTAALSGATTVGGSPAPASTAMRATRLGSGLSIVVPAHWHVALRLTGLAEPLERFTLASFALHRPPRQLAQCGPMQAVRTMPANGALAFVFEYATTGAFSRRDFRHNRSGSPCRMDRACRTSASEPGGCCDFGPPAGRSR